MKYLILLISIIVLSAFTIPEKVFKKADKVIVKYFEIEEFSKETIIVSEELNSKTISDFGESNLFKIIKDSQLMGYGYIGTAPSKTADFDYLILFDTDMVIIKSKVLIYREEYGGEIGSKRWLKQFNGSDIHTNELVYGDNIVPISGATISVKSMTKSVNDLLKSLKVLNNNKVY